MRRKGKNKGMAMLVALISMIILMSIVAVLSRKSQMSIKTTTNHVKINNSRNYAESGLAYIKLLISKIDLGKTNDTDETLNVIASGLASVLNGSAQTGGQSITRGTNNSIITPAIAFDNGQFSISITKADPSDAESNILVSAIGTSEDTSRTIELQLDVTKKSGMDHISFTSGISTNGTVKMTGSSSIFGKNDSTEADVFMTTNTDKILKITGTSSIEGDIYCVNPDAYVDYAYSTSVGGAFREDISDHVHTVDYQELPKIDTSAIVNSVTLTDISSDQSMNSWSHPDGLSNIRIKANSDVHFSGDVDLKGLIYIESPNNIKITGNVNITGMIVTEEGDSSNQCTIDVGGSNTFHPISDLPDTAAFAPLKQFQGTAIVAPGYEITFTGNTNSVGGFIAADNFVFKGYGNMLIQGGILCYGTGVCSLTGNQTIIIDKSGLEDEPPAGFVVEDSDTILVTLPNTYREVN